MDRPSNSVQEHIDRVHKEVYKKRFYVQGRYLGLQWPGGKVADLLRAEDVLKKLARPALPRALGDVRLPERSMLKDLPAFGRSNDDDLCAYLYLLQI